MFVVLSVISSPLLRTFPMFFMALMNPDDIGSDDSSRRSRVVFR